MAAEMKADPVFSVSQLRVFLGKHLGVEVSSLKISAGECVAVLGPNGSGKSSFLRGISGIAALNAESRIAGEVQVDGRSILSEPEMGRARLVGYYRDSIETEFPVVVRDLLGISREFHPGNSDHHLDPVEKSGIGPLLEQKLSSLSGGERQRLLLAMGLVQAPRVLALDETLSQLDLDQLWKMGAMLRAQARSKASVVLLVTHEWNFASRWADRILIFQKGRCIADGAPKAVVTQKNLDALYPGWAATVVEGMHPQIHYPTL